MKLKNLPKNGMMRIATLFVFALILTFSTTLTAQDASLLMHLPFDGTIEDMKPGDSKVAITNISTGQTTNFNNTIAKKGECIDFDADGHYPVLQTPADFLNPYPETNRNGFSISLWYYAHSLAGHQMMNQLGNNGKNTITVGGDEQLHSYLGGVTGPLMTMEAGKWYHIALVIDNGGELADNTGFFYIDGVKIDTDIYEAEMPSNTEPWNLNATKASVDATKPSWMLDEYMIFDGVLTQAQIDKLVALDHSDWDSVPPPLPVADASLLMYLPFDGTVEDMKVGDKVEIENISTGEEPNFITEGAKLGQCLDFDVAGNLPIYKTPANFINPLPTEEPKGYSFAFWYYGDEFTGHQMISQEDQADPAATGKNHVNVSKAGAVQCFAAGGTTSVGDLTLKQWHHIAMVMSVEGEVADREGYFYIDGVKKEYDLYEVAIQSNDMGWFLNGLKNATACKTGWKLDELFMFEGRLSDDQVAKLADLDHSDWDITTPSVADASLLMYLPFDGTVDDKKAGEKVEIENISAGEEPNFITEGAKLGQCLDFDVAGNLPIYKTPANFINPLPTEEPKGYSFAFWYYGDEFMGHQMMSQEDQADPAATGKNHVNVSKAGAVQCFAAGGTTSVGDLTLKQWHHVAMVMSVEGAVADREGYFYIDGVKKEYDLYQVAIQSNDMGWYLNGLKNATVCKTGWKFDELFMFEGRLSDDQVAKLADLDYSDWQLDPPTSIESDFSSDLKLYPNPTNGTLTVSGVDAYAPYRVYNITGSVKLQGELEGNSINLSGLNDGIWFVQVGGQVSKVVLHK